MSAPGWMSFPVFTAPPPPATPPPVSAPNVPGPVTARSVPRPATSWHLFDLPVSEATSPPVSDNERTDEWKLLKELGDKTVEYRYAAAWRPGRLVGYVFTGDTPMMVVVPIMRDEDMAMRMNEGWEERIRWADDVAKVPDRFILVSVDQVRAPVVISRKHISRNPHTCPVCKQPALIMVTQVHCTNSGCKNWDRES